MINYETIFIADPDVPETGVNEINAKLTGIIKKHEGQINKIDDWGTRKLGYTINKKKRGHYVCVHYSALPGVVSELERTLNLREDVLKQITVRLKEGE